MGMAFCSRFLPQEISLRLGKLKKRSFPITITNENISVQNGE